MAARSVRRAGGWLFLAAALAQCKHPSPQPTAETPEAGALAPADAGPRAQAAPQVDAGPPTFGDLTEFKSRWSHVVHARGHLWSKVDIGEVKVKPAKDPDQFSAVLDGEARLEGLIDKPTGAIKRVTLVSPVGAADKEGDASPRSPLLAFRILARITRPSSDLSLVRDVEGVLFADPKQPTASTTRDGFVFERRQDNQNRYITVRVADGA